MLDRNPQQVLAAVASQEQEWVVTLAVLGMIVMAVVLAAIVVGVVTSRVAAIRAARRAEREAAERGERSYGFPVVTEAAVGSVAAQVGQALPVQDIGRGPGRYRIVGVVAATGTDIRMYV